MATKITDQDLDIQLQMASINQALNEAARARMEANQRQEETKLESIKILFQGATALAAVAIAAATIVKLFFT